MILDIHTGNLVYRDKKWDDVAELQNILTKPVTGNVNCSEVRPVDTSVPRYLVRSSSLRAIPTFSPSSEIRLIDFGESFKGDDKPKTLNTPLSMRAPELIFEDKWDYRVDLWSAGCAVCLL